MIILQIVAALLIYRAIIRTLSLLTGKYTPKLDHKKVEPLETQSDFSKSDEEAFKKWEVAARNKEPDSWKRVQTKEEHNQIVGNMFSRESDNYRKCLNCKSILTSKDMDYCQSCNNLL